MAAVTSTEQAGQGGGGPAARQRALPAGKCPSKAEAAGQCARAAGRAAGRRSRISYCCSSAGHGGARARRDAQAPPGGRHGPRHVTRLHPKGHEKRQNQNQRSPSLLSYGPLRAAVRAAAGQRCCCSKGQARRKATRHRAFLRLPEPPASLRGTRRNVLVTGGSPGSGTRARVSETPGLLPRLARCWVASHPGGTCRAL